MLKENKIAFLFLILALFIFVGRTSDRLVKAKFLSYTIYSPFINSVNSIKKIMSAYHQNEILTKENSRQKLEILYWKNKVNEIDNVNNILKDHESIIPDFVVANLIGVSQDYNAKSIIIDKGRIDGITRDLPVISSDGVVGKIINPVLNHSIVLPINHPKFRLSAMTKKNKVQGILINDKLGNSKLTMISLESEIAKGDSLITSNLSSLFPKGLNIGTVEKVISSSNNLFLEAEINLFINPLNIENVMILKNSDLRIKVR